MSAQVQPQPFLRPSERFAGTGAFGIGGAFASPATSNASQSGTRSDAYSGTKPDLGAFSPPNSVSDHGSNSFYVHPGNAKDASLTSLQAAVDNATLLSSTASLPPPLSLSTTSLSSASSSPTAPPVKPQSPESRARRLSFGKTKAPKHAYSEDAPDVPELDPKYSRSRKGTRGTRDYKTEDEDELVTPVTPTKPNRKSFFSFGSGAKNKSKDDESVRGRAENRKSSFGSLGRRSKSVEPRPSASSSSNGHSVLTQEAEDEWTILTTPSSAVVDKSKNAERRQMSKSEHMPPRAKAEVPATPSRVKQTPELATSPPAPGNARNPLPTSPPFHGNRTVPPNAQPLVPTSPSPQPFAANPHAPQLARAKQAPPALGHRAHAATPERVSPSRQKDGSREASTRMQEALRSGASGNRRASQLPPQSGPKDERRVSAAPPSHTKRVSALPPAKEPEALMPRREHHRVTQGGLTPAQQVMLESGAQVRPLSRKAVQPAAPSKRIDRSNRKSASPGQRAIPESQTPSQSAVAKEEALGDNVDPVATAPPALAPEALDDSSVSQKLKPRFEHALTEYPVAILGRIFEHLDHRSFKPILAVSRNLRDRLSSGPAQEVVLERYLRDFGYRSQTLDSDSMPLTLNDLDIFHASMEYSLSEYAILASEHKRSALPTRTVRLLRASTRVHNKLVARLRSQPNVQPSSAMKQLFKPGRAAVLRVWIPCRSQWMADDELVECERELHRAGVWQLMRRGDLVRNVAVSDLANEGMTIFDGQYLRDLSFTHDNIGHLPAWLNALAFSPSYFHNQIAASTTEPVFYLDLSPFVSALQSSMQLCKDKASIESPSGDRYHVNRYVYRCSIDLIPGAILGENGGTGGSGPGGIECLHEDWEGKLVVECDGTAEAAKELLRRATPVSRKKGDKGQPLDGHHPYKVVRSLSRPGQIFVRPVV